MACDLKCPNKECLVKEVCFRWTSKPRKDQKYFSYKMKVVWINFKANPNKGRCFICDGFWVLYNYHQKWAKISREIKKEDKWYLKAGKVPAMTIYGQIKAIGEAHANVLL